MNLGCASHSSLRVRNISEPRTDPVVVGWVPISPPLVEAVKRASEEFCTASLEPAHASREFPFSFGDFGRIV